MIRARESHVATVFDAAQYVLELLGKENKLPITTWKLQKLVYYSQAWAAVWDDKCIFQEPIEAWANGPVCPTLYSAHRGQFKVESLDNGDPKNLSKEHKKTVKSVVGYYGDKTAQYLSELTHRERPWIDARAGLSRTERGNNEITVDAMAEYYGGL